MLVDSGLLKMYRGSLRMNMAFIRSLIRGVRYDQRASRRGILYSCAVKTVLETLV